MGRLLKDPSPTSLALILLDAIRPHISLIPVPEFPKSMGLLG